MLGVVCDPNGPGVYGIVNLRTTRVYIGSSVNIRKRWLNHRSHLRNGTHHCLGLQAEWANFGESFFSLVVLEPTPPAYRERMVREQWWIDHTPDILNTLRKTKVGPTLGKNNLTPEGRARIKAFNTGRKVSPEAIARRLATLKGRMACSLEQRVKISAALKRHYAEHPRSDETCAKLSAANTGHRHTPEQYAAMAETKRGSKAALETRLKMSEAQKRRHAEFPISDETRGKISASNKVTWAATRRVHA